MGEPQLSIVVACSEGSASCAAIWEAWRAAVEDGSAELILVSARADGTDLPARDGLRFVRCAPGTTVPSLRAAGWSAARAPIVALSEGFCVPADGWHAALLAAHAQSRAAAVGGAVARRGGSRSEWALTFAEYGRFFGALPAGPVADLPGINVSYRRDRLLAALGGAPAELVETEVHARLRAAGELLWRAPEALVLDEQRLPLGRAARALYGHGRLFAGRRARDRSLVFKLFRCLASPLVPVVLGARIRRHAQAAQQGAALRRALPCLALLLGSWAAGEAVGSLCGAGRSAEAWT